MARKKEMILAAPPIFDLMFGVQVALVAAIGTVNLFVIGWYLWGQD
jgi:hypothetical protein